MEETKDGEVAADDSEGVSSDAPGNSLAETSTSYEAPESGAVKPDCGGCSLYRDVVCSVWWHPRDAFRPLTKMQMPTPAASWSLRFAATVQRRLVALHFEVRHKRGLERLKRMPALKRARHVQIREQYMRCSLPLARENAADARAPLFAGSYGAFEILCSHGDDEVDNSGPDSTNPEIRREWERARLSGRSRRFVRMLRRHAFALWRRKAASCSSKQFASAVRRALSQGAAAAGAAPPSSRAAAASAGAALSSPGAAAAAASASPPSSSAAAASASAEARAAAPGAVEPTSSWRSPLRWVGKRLRPWAGAAAASAGAAAASAGAETRAAAPGAVEPTSSWRSPLRWVCDRWWPWVDAAAASAGAETRASAPGAVEPTSSSRSPLRWVCDRWWPWVDAAAASAGAETRASAPGAVEPTSSSRSPLRWVCDRWWPWAGAAAASAGAAHSARRRRPRRSTGWRNRRWRRRSSWRSPLRWVGNRWWPWARAAAASAGAAHGAKRRRTRRCARPRSRIATRRSSWSSSLRRVCNWWRPWACAAAASAGPGAAPPSPGAVAASTGAAPPSPGAAPPSFGAVAEARVTAEARVVAEVTRRVAIRTAARAADAFRTKEVMIKMAYERGFSVLVIWCAIHLKMCLVHSGNSACLRLAHRLCDLDDDDGETIAALKAFLFRCARDANKGALAVFVCEFRARREEARAELLEKSPPFVATLPLPQNATGADMHPAASREVVVHGCDSEAGPLPVGGLLEAAEVYGAASRATRVSKYAATVASTSPDAAAPVTPPTQIFIRLTTDMTITLDVDLNDSIASVKETLYNDVRVGIPVADQRLLLGGTHLVNDRALSSYGVGNDSTLDVDGRLLGGVRDARSKRRRRSRWSIEYDDDSESSVVHHFMCAMCGAEFRNATGVGNHNRRSERSDGRASRGCASMDLECTVECPVPACSWVCATTDILAQHHVAVHAGAPIQPLVEERARSDSGMDDATHWRPIDFNDDDLNDDGCDGGAPSDSGELPVGGVEDDCADVILALRGLKLPFGVSEEEAMQAYVDCNIAEAKREDMLNNPLSFSPGDIDEVEVMAYVQSRNWSDSTYDDIMGIIKNLKTEKEMYHTLRSSVVLKKRVLERVQEKTPRRVIRINYSEPVGEKAGFDFSYGSLVGTLKELLTDKELQKKAHGVNEMLLRAAPLDGPDAVLSQLNEGPWWDETEKAYCGEDPLSILGVIHVFIDKTHCDDKGSIKMVPVIVTCGNYTKELNRHPDFARSVASLPAENDISSADQQAVASRKVLLRAKHDCMEALLAEMKGPRAGRSFLTYIRGVLYRVFPVIDFIINDTAEADALALHYAGGGAHGVQSPCRYCHVTKENRTQNTAAAPRLWEATKAMVMEHKAVMDQHVHGCSDGNTAAAAALQETSLHPIINAFWGVDFGVNDRGIYGALPIEGLHQMEKGLMKYWLEQVIYEIRYHGGVQAVSRLDAEARARDDCMRHQSERLIGSKSYTGGITDIPKLSAQEMPAVLRMMIACIGDDGSYLRVAVARRWTSLAWDLIVVRDMLMADKWTGKMRADIKVLVPQLMDNFREVVGTSRELEAFKGNRGENGYTVVDGGAAGCGFPKFHLMTHYLDFLMRYGPPVCAYSGFSESAHKTFAKNPTKRVQRRVPVVLGQVEDRLWWTASFKSFAATCALWSRRWGRQITRLPPVHSPDALAAQVVGPGVDVAESSELAEAPSSSFHPGALEAIRAHATDVPGRSATVKVHLTLKIPRLQGASGHALFHADPEYGHARAPWRDFAEIDMSSDGIADLRYAEVHGFFCRDSARDSRVFAVVQALEPDSPAGNPDGVRRHGDLTKFPFAMYRRCYCAESMSEEQRLMQPKILKFDVVEASAIKKTAYVFPRKVARDGPRIGQAEGDLFYCIPRHAEWFL